MSGFDEIEYGSPPAFDGEGVAFGARVVRGEGGSIGVRIMLKQFSVMVDPSDGAPVAFISVRVAGAVQAVQAVRQAIGDARRGRVR